MKKEAVSGEEIVKIKPKSKKSFPFHCNKKKETGAALINHQARPVVADESSSRSERRENKRQAAPQSVASSASWAPLGRLRPFAIVLSLNELSPSSALLPLRVCQSFSLIFFFFLPSAEPDDSVECYCRCHLFLLLLIAAIIPSDFPATYWRRAYGQ